VSADSAGLSRDRQGKAGVVGRRYSSFHGGFRQSGLVFLKQGQNLLQESDEESKHFKGKGNH
jgi:hypothetical protein